MLDAQNNLKNRPPGQDLEYHGQEPLNRNQKIAIGVLAVFGFFIIYFWFVQFQNNLSGKSRVSGNNKNTEAANDSQYEADSRIKDTDNDGLTDWEELNLHGTSPYLEDSDSDGISDKKEIDQGTDPNCPVGKDCADLDGDLNDMSANNSGQIETSGLNNLLESLNQLQSSPDIGDTLPGDKTNQITSKEPTGTASSSSGKIDAATLRQLLLTYGLTKEMLDSFSDEQLLESYSSVLNGESEK